jgi:nucleoside-triphosphatase
VKILLEGRPGSGKTTVAWRLLEILKAAGDPVRGFVTREIRERGRRVGFSFETADGTTGTLAHVDFSGPPRVGKYGVDLKEFERVVVPVVSTASRRDILLMDELGKMELASKSFRDAAVSVFDDDETVVVATVHLFRHPVTDALKRRREHRPHSGDFTQPRRLARSYCGAGEGSVNGLSYGK